MMQLCWLLRDTESPGCWTLHTYTVHGGRIYLGIVLAEAPRGLNTLDRLRVAQAGYLGVDPQEVTQLHWLTVNLTNGVRHNLHRHQVKPGRFAGWSTERVGIYTLA